MGPVLGGALKHLGMRFKDTHYGFVRDDLLSDRGSYTPC